MYFCKTEDDALDKGQILERIKQLAFAVLPQGSSLWLYGSRARGDENQGSDWDLLVLLDKSRITSEDYIWLKTRIETARQMIVTNEKMVSD